MVTQHTLAAARSQMPVFELIKRAWSFNRTLTLLALLMAVSTVGGLVGMLADPRLVLGASTWAKTTKFSISVLLYSATILWMLTYVQGRLRLARFVGSAIGAILLFEMALIILQGFRGRAMHFNVATPFEESLWSAMSATIIVLFVFNLVGLGLLLFQRLPNPALTWGIRLGMLVMIIGLAEGYLMPPPSAEQMARLEAGEQLDLIGAHTVGAPDGGPGLPFVGWSTTHGDLRIGHFVGLHGMQALPLLGWLLARRRDPQLRDRHRVALVAVGAAGYTGLVALVTWQALRGQPLLAPDALTLGALAALVAATLAAAGAILLHARRTAIPV
jgi:hypothetical protein